MQYLLLRQIRILTKVNNYIFFCNYGKFYLLARQPHASAAATTTTATTSTVRPRYKDIGLYDVSYLTSDFPWYELTL
jgi:hypothetical protein